jgi:Thiamine pyrophosphate-requiring enzymes [acetolactate synthase, pyruvate dehydrogenase (cytochrome), glyoxylate carboligase, phosphonopyruvate decarboxylase]
MPIITSVLAKGIINDNVKSLMGCSGRLSTKPANEAIAAADLILFVGSDFPFVKVVFPPDAKFIQVDIHPARLGSRHKTDVAILGDAKETMKRLTELGKKRETTPFYRACLINKQNWTDWLKGFECSDEIPLRPEPVFKEINRIAEENAVFTCDVGNVTIFAVRMLEMNEKQRFTTSGRFATMGYGVPSGIAAGLSCPGRQVFTLNGDGGFAMVMQDIITQVKYKQSIINIVFSNNSFGFIEGEQEDNHQTKYGVHLQSADFAKVAEGMGAKGFTVTHRSQLKHVFDQAKASELPVVIDVKITNDRPFPAEAMVLDEDKYGKAKVEAFKKRYEVERMPLLAELMDVEMQ